MNYLPEVIKRAVCLFQSRKSEFFEFGVREKKGLHALGVEVNLDLVILGHLITIDTDNRTVAEDAMGDA